MNNAKTTTRYTPLYIPEASPLLKLLAKSLRVISVITFLCSLWVFASASGGRKSTRMVKRIPYD